MVTKVKEEEAASGETPEEPSVPSPSDGAAPEEPAAQQEETPQLTLDDAKAQLREVFSTPEGKERLNALLDIVDESVIEERFGPVIESRAQSKADRANWQAQFNDDVRQVNEWLQEEYGKLAKDGIADEDVQRFSNLGGAYVNRLRDTQLKYGLKSHKTENFLTPEDVRLIASVKDEPDAAVRTRKMLHVYLDRAYQKGIEDSEGVVKGKVEKELGVAEKLKPLYDFLSGGATKPPVTSPSAGAAPQQMAWEQLEAAYGSGLMPDGTLTSPEINSEYLRRKAEREKRG